MDGASVYDLLENQQCNTTAAVPTVWLGLLQHMRDNHLRLSSLKSCVIGGSAAPLSMIKAFQEGAFVCNRQTISVIQLAALLRSSSNHKH